MEWRLNGQIHTNSALLREAITSSRLGDPASKLDLRPSSLHTRAESSLPKSRVSSVMGLHMLPYYLVVHPLLLYLRVDGVWRYPMPPQPELRQEFPMSNNITHLAMHLTT